MEFATRPESYRIVALARTSGSTRDFPRFRTNHVSDEIGNDEAPGRRSAAGTESPQARFVALLARHAGIVFKVANIYSRDAEDGRDIAQEICTQLWRAYPNYDEDRSFSTWMYRVALNVGISHWRSSTHRDRYLSSLDDAALAAIPDPAVHEPDDRVAELYRVIHQLGDLDRALILLYLEGRSYREISEVLGISETNVATKLNRLKQRLRKELADSQS